MTQESVHTTQPVTTGAPAPVFSTHQRLSWLIHGQSKKGKSTLAATAPKPVLVLDAEGSWRFIPGSIRYWDPLHETPPVWDGTWDICIVHVREWSTVDMVYKYLLQWPNLFTTTGPVSVVVDSITEIQRRCFVPDTDLLTPTGWIPIADVEPGDVVAQYERDTERVSFVPVDDVQRFHHSGEIVTIKTNFADVAVTPDHRMLVRNTKQHPTYERSAESLIGGTHYLPVAGVSDGSIDAPTDDEIRLIVALQADSYHATTNVYAFNLRKIHKKQRLEALCRATGVRYRRIEGKNGWTHFRVWRNAIIDKWLPEKTYQWPMLMWPVHARRVFIDELGRWDGSHSIRGVHYGTTNEQNAEVIAAVAVSSGYGVNDRTGTTRIGTPYHRIHLSNFAWRRSGRSDFIATEPYDGPVHCVTVPSGFLVTRRHGKTTIAGNCKQNLKGTEAMKIQDWGVLLSAMDSTIRGFRDLCLIPQLTVRCVVFISETRESNTGRMVPYMQGQIAVSLPYWVDICGYMYPDYDLDANGQATREKRTIWISPHPQYEAGERVQGRLGGALTFYKPPDGAVGIEIDWWMRVVFGLTG